ncbi:hypothetical protein SFRURICE_018325 [Spodoptera frugiperda]|nr:hypothetical protein SFRURICE_018325 [Spodoptera frugiperda]
MDTHKLPLHICNSIKQYMVNIDIVSRIIKTYFRKINEQKRRLTLELGLQEKLKIVILLVLLMTQNSDCNGFGGRNSMLRTRVIGTRYGKLQGVILPMDQHKYLKPVEAYLGVPYATPPTGSNRTTISSCHQYSVWQKIGRVLPWEGEGKGIDSLRFKLRKWASLYLKSTAGISP